MYSYGHYGTIIFFHWTISLLPNWILNTNETTLTRAFRYLYGCRRLVQTFALKVLMDWESEITIQKIAQNWLAFGTSRR